MKKILSIIMSITIIMLSIAPIMSFAEPQPNIYTYPSGEAVEYYIDDDGHEFVYRNGQKVYILLPLEKYRVTDEKLLESLDFDAPQDCANLTSDNAIRSASPIILKTLYNANSSLPIVTGYMNYPANASFIRIKTTNCKPALKSKKLNFHIYIKQVGSGEVLDYHYFDMNCTSSTPFELSGQIAAQVNVSVVSYHGMTSCTLALTATQG